MRWKRQAPGYYTAFGSTTVTKDGVARAVPIRVEVVRNEGWDPRAEQWYVNVFGQVNPDHESTLCDGSRGDSIHFTMTDAKRGAEEMVRNGFTFFRQIGWALSPT